MLLFSLSTQRVSFNWMCHCLIAVQIYFNFVLFKIYRNGFSLLNIHMKCTKLQKNAYSFKHLKCETMQHLFYTYWQGVAYQSVAFLNFYGFIYYVTQIPIVHVMAILPFVDWVLSIKVLPEYNLTHELNFTCTIHNIPIW